MSSDPSAGHWQDDVDYGARPWTDIEKGMPSQPIVVVPTGAVEVYGPHLPLASDSIVAEQVAGLVAHRLQGLRTPLVPVGYSRDLMSFPGTLSVQPEAFLAYLRGICKSLLHWGFADFLFLNTHLGNVALVDQLALDLIEEKGARCLQIDWWRFCTRHGGDLLESGSWAAGHAGEVCTSVLMYLAEYLVRQERMSDFVPEGDPWPAGIEEYVPYRDITADGVLGLSSLASREKGEAIVKRAVDAIVEEATAHFGAVMRKET